MHFANQKLNKSRSGKVECLVNITHDNEKNSLRIKHAGVCCVCCSAGACSRCIDRFHLRQSFRRQLDRCRRLRIRLAAGRRGEGSELASILGRILGVHGLRVDLDQLRGFRLGHVSLRSLGQSRGLRLVWLPGTDLDWGPAWVSWRTGGDYIGWAPLPPRGPGVVYDGQPIGARVDIEYDIGPQYYNFCDVRFIGEPVLRDRIFPPTQNITYITNTVNVTNITVQNNVVYNY